MTRPTLEVADILRAQGDRFLDRYRSSFDFQQLKAFRAIQRCRTAALGGHQDACLRWLAARERELLATSYFHVVFTVPRELHVLALDNARLFYDLLFTASAQTLLQIAADPKHLGAEIGVIALDPECRICIKHEPKQLSRNLFWGLGWGIERKDGTDALWHWGDNGSFKAFVMADPKTKSGVVMFANSEKGLEVAKPVVDEVMGRGSLAFEWLK
jgi:hypothetical protein